MITYARAWWRGVGVLGLYIWLTFVMGAVGLVAGALAEAVPEGIRYVLAIPLLLFGVPPLLYWSFRWTYPDASTEKRGTRTPSPE